jgi:hypothetical protein
MLNTKEIQKKMDTEVRTAILSDEFSKKSKFSKFLYTHIPPFNMAQREADIADCNKSVIAASLFNQKKLAEGVKPIAYDIDEFPACKRLAKK